MNLLRQIYARWFPISPWTSVPEAFVQDMIWIAVTLAFFALSIAYVRYCERMK